MIRFDRIKRVVIFNLTVIIVVLFLISPPVNAKSGCCSSHGGVCGCKCCDGTALSEKCAPYYPSCNDTPVYTPPTPTPYKADSQSGSTSGCCSWHGGISHCDTSVGKYVCKDGSYSPSCTCQYIPQVYPQVYPTSTPYPTSTLKPTSTPIPTYTSTPIPSSSPTITSVLPTLTKVPTISPSPTQYLTNSSLPQNIQTIQKVSQGEVVGTITNNSSPDTDGFFSKIFKAIFNLLTLNFVSEKGKTTTSLSEAVPTPTTASVSFGQLLTTPSVLGEFITNPTINSDELVEVVSVTDGDTIKVRIEEKIENVRLIGIDTPETVDPRKPVQCFGQEASSKAKELLSGHKVKLENDPTQSNRDKYQRLLRYAWREDGLFFNDWMVRNGYAHEYTYDIPYKYQAQFKEAEKFARENNLGLWNLSVCITSSPTTKVIPTTYTPPKEDSIPPTQPSIQYVQPTSPPTIDAGGFVCNCSKTCEQISSCNEAYYQLNQCGCLKRDGDKDGVPCEKLCPGG